MSTPGERAVRTEIENLRRKLRGDGGKNLNLREKEQEVKNVLETLNRLRRANHGKDIFFSSQEFKTLVQGLENILSGGGNGQGSTES